MLMTKKKKARNENVDVFTVGHDIFQNYSDTFSLHQFVPWPSEFKLKNKNNGYYTNKINVSFP